MRTWIGLAISLFGLAACNKPPQPAATVEAPPAAQDSAATAGAAAIDAAIASTARPEGDRDQDGWRKPAEVLRFMELRPGMRVIDYFASGGYYTELMARVVGPQGHVVAYNNASYLKYAGDQPAKRYDNNRLPNVAQLTTAPEDAPFEPQSFDAVLFMQAYHDLYWRAQDDSWPATDPARALAKLVPALKPGAIVVVVDHVAAAGSDPLVTVDKLHRIDPEVLKRDFAAAGLTFETESTAFRNESDDHSKEVFDAAIRRKTDQVMYKFRKP